MRRRTIAIILAFSAAFLTSWAFAQSRDEIIDMTAAADLYDRALYVESAQTYQQIVDRGFQNPALYYNLGNAYFKQEDLGRAIINYRRAFQLDPNDSDITNNLDIARSRIEDAIISDELAFESLKGYAHRLMNIGAIVIAAPITLGVVCMLASVIVFRPRMKLRRWFQFGVAISGALALVTTVMLLYQLLPSERENVVIVARSVDVVSGPGSQYLKEFTLHSGTEIELMESRGTWVRISVANPLLQGWVPSSTIEPIDPDLRY